MRKNLDQALVAVALIVLVAGATYVIKTRPDLFVMGAVGLTVFPK